MKKLTSEEMVTIEGGGCTSGQNKTLAVVGAVATVASFIFTSGAAMLIIGPTAGGAAIAGIRCAFFD